MTNSRNKGAAYERDVRTRLEAELGMRFERVLAQTREVGLPDLVCEDVSFPFVIECKRYKTTSAFADPKWWTQACEAAEKAGKYPALVYKGDRLEERLRIPIQCLVNLSSYKPALDIMEQYDWFYACELSFDDFCMVVRELLCSS